MDGTDRAVRTGDEVIFVNEQGESVLAFIDHIWTAVLVNLRERKSGDVHTSVPHESQVKGATGFYFK